jgi:two-component system chemotaxis response regulator CheV
MPSITPIAGATAHSLGVVNLRGQIIPVLDLPAIVGCKPKTGLNIMLVTEYARTTQAFAVESVEDIVRLDWKQVLSAEASGAAGKLVTSIARWMATPMARAWRRCWTWRPSCKWCRRPRATRWMPRRWGPA